MPDRLLVQLDYLVTFFLPATVFLLPRLVLALVRVLCPRKGKPALCLRPRVQLISINLFIFKDSIRRVLQSPAGRNRGE